MFVLLANQRLQFGLANRVLVNVFDQYGGREGWAVMFAAAFVVVATGSDFEVEWAVYFVLFCTVNAGEVHGSCAVSAAGRVGGGLAVAAHCLLLGWADIYACLFVWFLRPSAGCVLWLD